MARALNNSLSAIERFFASWRFAALSLATLATFELGLVAISAIPRASTGLGHFAEEFRVWCWGYDPATGHFEWAYVVTMLGAPVSLGLLIGALWSTPLRAIVRERPRAITPWIGVGIASVAVALGLLMATRGDAKATELPFPARALRTEHRIADFAFENQNGDVVSLSGLRGNVVLLTGMYASCSYTCPLIMAQAKRAIGALEPAERRDVRFVAITLDPAHDDQKVLAGLGRAYGVEAPAYNYLWGEPGAVNAELDRLEIARRMDMTTGAIDHANLFILVDRAGRVAYRLSLSQREESWLVDALRVLVREAR